MFISNNLFASLRLSPLSVWAVPATTKARSLCMSGYECVCASHGRLSLVCLSTYRRWVGNQISSRNPTTLGPSLFVGLRSMLMTFEVMFRKTTVSAVAFLWTYLNRIKVCLIASVASLCWSSADGQKQGARACLHTRVCVCIYWQVIVCPFEQAGDQMSSHKARPHCVRPPFWPYSLLMCSQSFLRNILFRILFIELIKECFCPIVTVDCIWRVIVWSFTVGAQNIILHN